MILSRYNILCFYLTTFLYFFGLLNNDVIMTHHNDIVVNLAFCQTPMTTPMT